MQTFTLLVVYLKCRAEEMMTLPVSSERNILIPGSVLWVWHMKSSSQWLLIRLEELGVEGARADGLLCYSTVFVAYSTVRVNGWSVGSDGACCPAPRSPGSFPHGSRCVLRGNGGFNKGCVWWLQVGAIWLEEKEIIKAFNILLYKFPLQPHYTGRAPLWQGPFYASFLFPH